MSGMPDSNSPKILLGFDFGMKKIGIAIGQSITESARPLTIIKAQDGIPDWKSIKNLIEEWQVEALVVGLPYQLDGNEQEITRATRKFANRLQAQFKLPVYLIDERYSSKEARSQLNEMGAHKDSLDSYAAKLILESWFREKESLK